MGTSTSEEAKEYFTDFDNKKINPSLKPTYFSHWPILGKESKISNFNIVLSTTKTIRSFAIFLTAKTCLPTSSTKKLESQSA